MTFYPIVAHPNLIVTKIARKMPKKGAMIQDFETKTIITTFLKIVQ